jgi:trigger factor
VHEEVVRVTQVREAGPFERILTVVIRGDALRNAEGRAARKLSKDLKIKGFRPGKAPLKVVESVVGAERLRQEAVDEALPAVVADALRETELAPVTAPRVEEVRDGEDGVEVDVRVTLWPELDEVPEYQGRRVEIERPEVSDEDIDAQIERMQDQFAELEDVDREGFDGDYVLIDITTAAGEEIAKDLLYEIGSGSFLEGIDIPLRGSKVGSIEEFDTTLPPSFGDNAGEVVARVLVKQVKTKRLPELTDEWVDDVSEFETIAEMRDQLAADLAGYRAQAARSQLHDKLLGTLLDDLELELPEPLVEAEMDAVLHRFAHRLGSQGISLEQYFQISGQDQEGFVEDLRSQATTNLRTRVLLEAVAEREGIEVDDAEMDEAITSLAAASEKSSEEYRAALAQGGREQALAGDILRDKALGRLAELAVPVDADGNEVELPAPETREAAAVGDGADETEDAEGQEPAEEENDA